MADVAPDGDAAESGAARPAFAVGLVLSLAVLKLTLHLVTNAATPYEFHRDEFLYFAMGDHLRLWRMDFPPFIAMVSRLWRWAFGDSLFAIRLVPALAGTSLVLFAGLIARELGGRRAAQGIAALAVLANVLNLRSASLFQPVVLDQLWWTVALYALVRLGREDRPRWWVLLGLAGGFGLLTKFSVLFLGLAVLLALVATPMRRSLVTRWPYAALAIALLIGSPSIAGQVVLGWPVVEQLGVLRRVQLEHVTPPQFLLAQVMMFGPAVLLAALGLAALLAHGAMRPFRAAGWTCAFAFAVLITTRGKPYYIGPVYPALFAAGGVLLERVGPRRAGAALRWSAAAAMVAFGVFGLPFGLPILPPERMSAYVARTGVTAALRNNRGELERLPQDYGDMLGWKRMTEAVAAAYDSLPAAERSQVVVWGANYGEAGALAFYGPRYGLPPAVSDAGSFWFFGPGERSGRVLLCYGCDCADLRRYFRRVTRVGEFDDPWMVGEERHRGICVGTDPVTTLQQAWPGLAGHTG